MFSSSMQRAKRLMILQATLLVAACFFLFSDDDNTPERARESVFRQLGDEGKVEDDVKTGTADAQIFDTKDRFVLSTIPRWLTEEHPDRIKHIKFHLHCVADAMKRSDFHTILFTSDEDIAEYVKSSEDLPMEVSRVEPKEERLFTKNVKKMADLHPEASGYGFFNGDICPTPEFINATNEFFKVDCPQPKELGTAVESKWRFASGSRYDVDTSHEALDLENALDVALKLPRKKYWAPGIDLFAWNREMFMEHIVPETPDFSMPLLAADNYLFGDGNCNALSLMPTYGWNEDAVILHLNHYPGNGMPPSRHGHWNNIQEIDQKIDNRRILKETDYKLWKMNPNRGECSFRPDELERKGANKCHYNFTTGTFSCSRKVGQCKAAKR